MQDPFPKFARAAHAAHVNRCLTGLPASQIELDSSRLALGFYCIGTLDLLGALHDKTSDTDRALWREWIWEQQTHGPHGTGFRPSPFATPDAPSPAPYSEYDAPHLIMTYTALLTLAVLRDDFSKLDRPDLVRFVRACQQDDGSFTVVPGHSDNDLRSLYCAFCICDMLGDWSGVDVARACTFIETCRTYEGGYGQNSYCEASGGPTYIALAALHLAPRLGADSALTPAQRTKSIQWLVHNQDPSGGFRGRTGKPPDACYSFWCGAALHVVGAAHLVNAETHARFLARCQFKYGGIAKTPGDDPDPYHTYLAIAALALYPPHVPASTAWQLATLDPLLNARAETVQWIRAHVTA